MSKKGVCTHILKYSLVVEHLCHKTGLRLPKMICMQVPCHCLNQGILKLPVLANNAEPPVHLCQERRLAMLVTCIFSTFIGHC